MLDRFALLPGQAAFVQLMSQGGWIMWLLFVVALCQLWVFLWRWRHWETGLSTQPVYGLRLSRNAVRLRSLNQMEQGLPLLKALVVITPLLGLTGTVTGMMLVFDGLSFGSSADPRQLASGIARAILPTFAAMAVVLMGMFFLSLWQRRVRRALQNSGM